MTNTWMLRATDLRGPSTGYAPALAAPAPHPAISGAEP
jgi:hypothetical protein